MYVVIGAGEECESPARGLSRRERRAAPVGSVCAFNGSGSSTLQPCRALPLARLNDTGGVNRL